MFELSGVELVDVENEMPGWVGVRINGDLMVIQKTNVQELIAVLSEVVVDE